MLYFTHFYSILLFSKYLFIVMLFIYRSIRFTIHLSTFLRVGCSYHWRYFSRFWSWSFFPNSCVRSRQWFYIYLFIRRRIIVISRAFSTCNRLSHIVGILTNFWVVGIFIFCTFVICISMWLIIKIGCWCMLNINYFVILIRGACSVYPLSIFHNRFWFCYLFTAGNIEFEIVYSLPTKLCSFINAFT